jgi:hypothetical protein
MTVKLVSEQVKRCGTCRYFQPTHQDDWEDARWIGWCDWPTDRLPFSVERIERMTINEFDGALCHTHEFGEPKA